MLYIHITCNMQNKNHKKCDKHPSWFIGNGLRIATEIMQQTFSLISGRQSETLHCVSRWHNQLLNFNH